MHQFPAVEIVITSFKLHLWMSYLLKYMLSGFINSVRLSGNLISFYNYLTVSYTEDGAISLDVYYASRRSNAQKLYFSLGTSKNYLQKESA